MENEKILNKKPAAPQELPGESFQEYITEYFRK